MDTSAAPGGLVVQNLATAGITLPTPAWIIDLLPEPIHYHPSQIIREFRRMIPPQMLRSTL